MPPVGFELTISADEQPKTYASDRAATGTGFDIPNGGVKLKLCLPEEGITTAILYGGKYFYVFYKFQDNCEINLKKGGTSYYGTSCI
jgi:hypothetical protein